MKQLAKLKNLISDCAELVDAIDDVPSNSSSAAFMHNMLRAESSIENAKSHLKKMKLTGARRKPALHVVE
jgi:hypothetical protein